MNEIIYKLFRILPALKRIFYIYLNRLYFYLIGIKFGKNLRVHNKVYVRGKGIITIGDDFHLTSDDCLNPICRNLRAVLFVPQKESKIIIGNNVGMSSVCLWAQKGIMIGDNVNIGGDCLIMDSDAHPIDYMHRRDSFIQEFGQIEYESKIHSCPIIIEEDVWIGARCQILKGVKIGARSIIAAGSIVTKDIPSDVIAGGNPARIIKYLNNERL